MSANKAILFFGLIFDDNPAWHPMFRDDIEEEYEWEWEEDWDKKHGPVEPEDEDRSSIEWEKWREENKKYIKNGISVHVGCYLSYEFPMYYVGLKAHNYVINRGEHQEISPDLLASPRLDQIEALKTFCEIHSIPWSEPKWFIVTLEDY